MKKNILAIIILAATLVNLTLSAVCVFVVVPTTRRTDTLITKIISMVDMEIEGAIIQTVTVDDPSSIPITDKAVYAIEGDINIPLTRGPEDKKARFAQANVEIHTNKKAKGYKDTSALIPTNEGIIIETITAVIREYTADEINTAESIEAIKKEIVGRLNKNFDTTIFIDVVFIKLIPG